MIIIYSIFARTNAIAHCRIAMTDPRKRRTKADHDIGHEEYIPSLKLLLLQHNVKDLSQAVWHLDAETWKTRPRLELMVRYSQFYGSLFKVSPSGLILHSTLVNAILALDADCQCIIPAKGVPKQDHVASISNLIRCCLAITSEHRHMKHNFGQFALSVSRALTICNSTIQTKTGSFDVQIIVALVVVCLIGVACVVEVVICK